MSERCPGCRRAVATTDARCPRCGTGLLGVELEGDGFPTGGDELLVGRRGSVPTRRSPPRRMTLGAIAAVAVAIVSATVAGRDRSTGASSTTTTTTEPATSTTTVVAATEPTSSTTSTTIDEREIHGDADAWVAHIRHLPGDGPVSPEPTRLTMASANNNGDLSVRFTELDTGKVVEVSVGVGPDALGGGQYSSPLVFPGGAVIQMLTSNPVDPADPSSAPATALWSVIVSGDGNARSSPSLGALVNPNGALPANGAVQAWFFDRADTKLLHLVDLATVTDVRTVRIPLVATAVGVQGDQPVVTDPAGRTFVVAADGSVAPWQPAPGQLGYYSPATTGRQVVMECAVPLTSCVQTYIDEDGRRRPLLGADRALTTAAVAAPAGRHLTALYPATLCTDPGCRFFGPPPNPTPDGPIEIVDLDQSTTPRLIGTTSARSPGGYAGQIDGGVQWSTDGAWLFFSGTLRIQAWRPGLMQPVALTLPEPTLSNASGSAVVFYPTPPAAG